MANKKILHPKRIPRYSLKKLLKGLTSRNLNIDREWLDAPPVVKEIIED